MDRAMRWLVAASLMVALGACQQCEGPAPDAPESPGTEALAYPADAPTSPAISSADEPTTGLQLRVPRASFEALADPAWREQRLRMVQSQIGPQSAWDGRRPVRDTRVLEAMRMVPRHEFIPRAQRRYAHADSPLPIGHSQTISQPYIVGLMTELLRPKPGDRILEIGTGSGYQAAVLALLVKEVYTIEIVKPLARGAERDLQRLGYDNVHVRWGDGYRGWPDKAPFDGVIVTAAPERIPQPLLDQLKEGGRLVIPVGPKYRQELVVIHKTPRGPFRETVIRVAFVPMVGEVEKQEKD